MCNDDSFGLKDVSYGFLKLSTLVLCANRMRWFGYVLCGDGKIATVRKKTWTEETMQAKENLG